MRLRARPGPNALRSRALRRWIRGEPVWLPREQLEVPIPPLPDGEDGAFLTAAAQWIGRHAERTAAKETKRVRRRAARRP